MRPPERTQRATDDPPRDAASAPDGGSVSGASQALPGDGVATSEKEESAPTTGRRRERRGKPPGGDTVRRQLRGHLRAAGAGGKVNVSLVPPEAKEEREARYAARRAELAARKAERDRPGHGTMDLRRVEP